MEQKILLIPLETALDLEKLAAEAAEVGNAKSKVIEFGLFDKHEKTGNIPNIELLEKEIGHFLFWMEKLIADGVLNLKEIEKHKANKGPSAVKWRDYAMELRRLPECPECKQPWDNSLSECPRCGNDIPF